MMPMVDGFATRKIKDERLRTLQSHFLSAKNKKIEKDFH
jgi:hypothetical protein